MHNLTAIDLNQRNFQVASSDNPIQHTEHNHAHEYPPDAIDPDTNCPFFNSNPCNYYDVDSFKSALLILILSQPYVSIVEA